MKYFRKSVGAIPIAVSLFFSLGMSLDLARTSFTFIDEIRAIEEGYQFIRQGQFTVKPEGAHHGGFDPEGSIGIASVFPSALGWRIHGSLHASRVYLIFFHWILAMLAAIPFFVRMGMSKWDSLVSSNLTWALLLLHVPNSMTPMIQSLGELSAFLFLLLGCQLLLNSKHFWGGILVGIAIWHAKFIYLPFALVALFSLGFTLRGLAPRAFGFAIPLVIWLVIIRIQTGPEGLNFWLHNRMAFIVGGGSGLSGAPQIQGLWNRLAGHPDWLSLPEILRTKISFLFWGSIASLGYLLFVFRKSFSDSIFLGGSVGALMSFYAWFFLWKENMWLRHLLPGLVVSFFWISFAVYHRWLKLVPATRLISQFVFALAILLSVYESSDFVPMFNPDTWDGQIGESAGERLIRLCRTDDPESVGPYSLSACNPLLW